MAGVSTGISLLSVSNIIAPSLTYSTASVINNQWGGLVNKTYMASPDPDQFLATGFTSSPSQGLTISSSNGGITTISLDDTWPSYSRNHSMAITSWGNQTSTMTPSIKDSGGVVGTTSGSYICDLTRDFSWIRAGVQANAETTFSSSTTSTTNTIGLLLADYTGNGSALLTSTANCAVIENVPANFTSGGTPTNIRSITVTTCGGNEVNAALQVKAEHVSGNTTWEIYRAQTGSTGVKGTYYSVGSTTASPLFVRLDPRTTTGTTSSVIRLTFLHPNSGTTYSKDITLNLTKT